MANLPGITLGERLCLVIWWVAEVASLIWVIPGLIPSTQYLMIKILIKANSCLLTAKCMVLDIPYWAFVLGLNREIHFIPNIRPCSVEWLTLQNLWFPRVWPSFSHDHSTTKNPFWPPMFYCLTSLFIFFILFSPSPCLYPAASL